MKSEDSDGDGPEEAASNAEASAAAEVINKELVYRQVHYWLKDNQELMSRHEPEADYTSE